ncbi:MAG: hypothetical protein QME71_00665 [Dehalococcoidia bacterium]|nr:hypothetical protein [Dehalococcoidia bacterium]
MTEEEPPPEPAGGSEPPQARFERLFDDAYDFCLRLLLNPVAAAEAAEEGIARYSALPSSGADSGQARALLFREVLRAAAERSAQAARPFADPHALGLHELDPGRLPGLAPPPGEWAAIAWEALSRLTLEEYAFLDLHMRRGLGPEELALVYETSARSVQGKLERLEREVQADIAALITARQSAAGCDALRQALLALPLTATIGQVRRAVEAHCPTCPACAAFQQSLTPPLHLFSAMAGAAMPADVKNRVSQRISAAAAAAAAAPATAVPMPVPPPTPIAAGPTAVRPALGERFAHLRQTLGDAWSRFATGQRPLLPFAAALFVIGTALGIAWGTGMFGGSDGVAPVASPTPTKTPEATRTMTATPAPSPTEIATATPTEEPSPTPEPTASPTTEPPTPTEAPPPSPTAPPTVAATHTPPPSPSPVTTPTVVPSPEETPPAPSPTP